MKFRHPIITNGRIMSPQFGRFEILDGVVDCPDTVGQALGLERLPEEPPAPPETVEEPSAPEEPPAPKKGKK